MKKHLEVVLKNGYTKKHYGYIKEIDGLSHWITLHENTLDMFCMFTDDEYNYRLQGIKPTPEELQTLINLLTVEE